MDKLKAKPTDRYKMGNANARSRPTPWDLIKPGEDESQWKYYEHAILSYPYVDWNCLPEYLKQEAVDLDKKEIYEQCTENFNEVYFNHRFFPLRWDVPGKYDVVVPYVDVVDAVLKIMGKERAEQGLPPREYIATYCWCQDAGKYLTKVTAIKSDAPVKNESV